MNMEAVSILMLPIVLFTGSTSCLEIRFQPSFDKDGPSTYIPTVVPFRSCVTLTCECTNCSIIEFLTNRVVNMSRYYSGKICRINGISVNGCEANSFRNRFEATSGYNNTEWLCRGRHKEGKISQGYKLIISSNQATEEYCPGNKLIVTPQYEGRGLWSGVPYCVGGGVAVITIIVAVLVYISYRLKRKRSRWSSSAVEYGETIASPAVVNPGFVERDGEAVNESDQRDKVPQTAAASPEYLEPSFRFPHEVQRYSDVASDGYMVPHYCEVNEELMERLPQPLQSGIALSAVFYASSYVVDDGHTQQHLHDKGIRIPLVGESFGNTWTLGDSLPDEESRPPNENYERLFRNHYMTFQIP